MLEEATDDLAYQEAVGASGDVGPDAADAADYHEHAHAGLAGVGDLVDDVAVGERVHLHEDLRRLAAPRPLYLAVEAVHDEGLQTGGCYTELLVGPAQVSEREVAKEGVAILRDDTVGREEHEVGVEACGLLVEVSRAQTGDAVDAALVMVGDLTDLGVALKALGPIDDGAASMIEAIGPSDVVRLIEAGAQLHQHRDLLAVLDGSDEALAES